MKKSKVSNLVMTIKVRVMMILIICMVSNDILGNGVKIQNASVVSKDIVNDLVSIQFDLSWDNSWRTVGGCPSNWDAIWIFVKYKKNCCATWSHATINLTGHVATGGSDIEVPADKRGAFVYRSANGIGDMNCLGMSLRWNYGADGVGDSEILTVQVIGIEMVYINQEAFELGGEAFQAPYNDFSGLTDFNQAFGTPGPVNNIVITPFTDIHGHGPIGISGNGVDSDNDGLIDNPDFPTGYNAFYAMKYEVSQGQYAHFLSLLDATQSAARYSAANVGTSRYEIFGAPGAYSSTAPNVACNFINWFDALSYAEWAGLRPMTETEFEKACRGPIPSVPGGEFAWGDLNIHNGLYTIINMSLNNENVIAPVTGNASYSATAVEPLRTGIFASSAQNATRSESGSSYYGLMEMSGNLTEIVADIFGGPGFDGSHGSGSLDANGKFINANWLASLQKTGSLSPMITRGGSFLEFIDRLLVIDRSTEGLYLINDADRLNNMGFRCARTAP